ncbi:MAG: MarR family transcriptional regulator [Pirellula sp.]
MNASKTSQRKFDCLQQEAYLSLWRTYDCLKSIEDELFSRWSITAQQYNVLRLLEAASPEAMPTLAISNRLISRAPDITRMLDKLESRELVERLRSTEDRRAVLVKLTAKGKRLLREAADPLKNTHLRQLGHLSSAELRQLCELLRKARHVHEPEQSDW